jgi:hypothetical protein
MIVMNASVKNVLQFYSTLTRLELVVASKVSKVPQTITTAGTKTPMTKDEGRRSIEQALQSGMNRVRLLSDVIADTLPSWPSLVALGAAPCNGARQVFSCSLGLALFWSSFSRGDCQALQQNQRPSDAALSPK